MKLVVETSDFNSSIVTQHDCHNNCTDLLKQVIDDDP